MISTEFTKGDSFKLPFEYKEDLTGYKIRAEIWDTGSIAIKKANSESGGSDLQIKIDSTNPKRMEVIIDKDETTDIMDTASIEVEIENTAGERYTVFDESMTFRAERITWVTP